VRDRGSWSTAARKLAVDASLRGSVRRRLASYDEQSALVSFSPQHAREYRRAGINVRHARWFVPGPPHPTRRPLRDPFRLLHVGSVESSAGRTMLELWQRELLPALEELPFAVDLRLVGPAEIPNALASPPANVRVTAAGFVPDAELAAEYEQAAVFLSPMSYAIGVRTRILSAIAHGVPVLAHPSARDGLPELQPDKEIVYAASGRDLADVIARLHADPATAERVGAAGRSAWERLFNPESNVPLLLGLAGLGRATAE
jgi:glycosyltransferase involved in cell wall biosynthesis